TLSKKVSDCTQYQGTPNVATDVLTIREIWRGIEYKVGQGNFPLWESVLLRDKAFRKLFKDWQDGGENFPDIDQGFAKKLGEFGDATTVDPNTITPPGPITYGSFPAYVPFAPTAIAPTTAPSRLVVGPGNVTITAPAAT